MSYWAIAFVFAMTVVGVVGDSFLKLAGKGPAYIDWRWFVLGFVVYALTAFGWFYVMRFEELSEIGIVYALSNVILLVLTGVLIFGDTLDSFEIAGLVMAIFSILLLGRFA